MSAPALTARPLTDALTPGQLALLQVLVECIDATGVAPTYDDLAEELGLRSKSGVSRLMTGLETRGWVARPHGRSRAIRILHRPPMPDFGVTFTLSAAPLPDALAAELAAADREYGRCSAA